MTAVLITSSILILVLAALRPLLRGRIDPRLQYALWLVAALRLLVPVNLADSAFSALALLDRGSEPARVAEAIGQTTVPAPAMSYEDAYDQALREYLQDRPATVSFTDLDEVERRARQLQAEPPTLAQLTAKYAKPVWLGGAAAMGLWFLLVNLRLRRKLRAALPVEADCPLPVHVTPDLPSPCLCGTLRPAVYVTPAALADPDRMRHVLAHELTHYRHKDHWWALVRCLCLCLYWFDPLVWWAAALSRQDCELACDEGAIRRLGEGERLPYGRTLVDMIAAGRNSLLTTATTMTGGKGQIKKRIQLIARRPKTALAAALALVVILTCAVGCTFTGAPESPDPEPSGTTAPEPVPSEELTADTLRERLNSIPQELRSKVTNSADLYDDTAVLANYWLNDPKWQDLWSGYLLSLYRMDEARIREELDQQLWPAPPDIFARSGDEYYVLQWPSDGRYQDDDALSEEYWGALNTLIDYVKKTVLETEGVEPFDPDSLQPEDGPSPAQQAVQAVVERLLAAPMELTLAPVGSSQVYAYPYQPGEDGYWDAQFPSLYDEFQWEETDIPTSSDGDILRISSQDGMTALSFFRGSFLMMVEQDKEFRCYKGRSIYGGDITPYGRLRWLFDEVELAYQRTTCIPDRGQSHQDVVKEWIEGYEGAMAKCAPGSQFACTYVQGTDVESDRPDWMDQEELEAFVRSRNFVFTAEDFKKTWFGFRYSLVFVPENENARNVLLAGNTHDYEGNDAPEGAMVYTRMGFMWLTDEGWTCVGTGTSW